jgi:hypothetical protein
MQFTKKSPQKTTFQTPVFCKLPNKNLNTRQLKKSANQAVFTQACSGRIARVHPPLKK